MSDSSENNKRIAKNTILLYIRMLLLMLVSLYTSRVVLNALGVDDYGIYNVVGGVVAMFSVLSGSFSASVSRFMTFSLGENDFEKLKRVFSTSLVIQTSLAIVIVIIAEVLGIWFLNYKLNIPAERLGAANWVMHCSILVFAINLLSVPFNATIIAHEKMGIFALVSILDGLLKLTIALIISFTNGDRLIMYALLLLVVSVVVYAIYVFYCISNFKECRFSFMIDKLQLKEMTGFAGWTMLGNGAYVFSTQGVNILINMFFGVALNAARGVATQVEGAVGQFVNSFMTAMNPQITKSYAEGNLEYMHSLVCRGAKFSFFLMLFFAVPICIETEQILTIWLKVVPDYSISFVRLTFVTSMCTVMGNTLVTSQLATGQVKNYQIIVSSFALCIFPLTWIAFRLGSSPVWTYIIYAIIYFILIFVRIYLVKDLIKLSWQKYITGVLLRCFLVAATAFVFPVIIYKTQDETILRLIEVIFISALSVAVCIYTFGLDNEERIATFSFFKKVKSKINGSRD